MRSDPPDITQHGLRRAWSMRGTFYAGLAAGCTSRAIAQMKAAISRAIAVTATVGFLPLETRDR
jgi:hypothetical protein